MDMFSVALNGLSAIAFLISAFYWWRASTLSVAQSLDTLGAFLVQSARLNKVASGAGAVGAALICLHVFFTSIQEASGG